MVELLERKVVVFSLRSADNKLHHTKPLQVFQRLLAMILLAQSNFVHHPSCNDNKKLVDEKKYKKNRSKLSAQIGADTVLTKN